MDEDFVCLLDDDDWEILSSMGSISLVLLLLLLALVVSYKYRGEIKIWLYRNFGWRFFEKTDDTDVLGKVSALQSITL